MRVLLVSSRYPWPPYSGDRLRTTMWIDALTGIADVTLVVPPAPRHDERTHLRVFHARRAPWQLLSAVVTVLRRRLPWHTLMSAGFDWRGAIQRAVSERPFDVSVVVLSRLDPWVWDSLPKTRTILDAIDSLSASMRERRKHAAWPVARWFWAGEETRMTALENEIGQRYDAVLLVNAEERSWFGPRVEVVPVGAALQPLTFADHRPYTFGFWGRLAYFANRDAARYLVREIWPSIRRTMPDASLIIAGVGAPRDILRLHGRDGIVVQSPASDIARLARQIRIALFPIRFSTGQLSKVVEAAEGGCAIVASSQAMRGLEQLRPQAVVADEADAMISAAVDLANNPDRAERLGRLGRAEVEKELSREEMMRRLASVAAPRSVK